MSIDDRRLFLELADTGSFAGVARRLGLSRSTVMRRMEALEKELGLVLLQRGGRRIALTESGRHYVVELRPLLRSLERVEQEVRESAGRLAGVVRLSLPVLGTSAFLAPRLTAFQRQYPGIELQITLGRDPRSLQLGTFDVALQLGLRANPELIGRVVYQEELVLVASATYLEEAGRPGTVDALASHRCILERDLQGTPIPWRLADGRPVETTGSLQVNSMGFAYELVRAGAGIARVPRLLARDGLADGSLELVLPEVSSRQPVVLVHPRAPPPTTRVLVDFFGGR